MSASDREVYMTARQVIRHHGASAAYLAAYMADALLDKGDLASAAEWRRIVKAIEVLQAIEREDVTRH